MRNLEEEGEDRSDKQDPADEEDQPPHMVVGEEWEDETMDKLMTMEAIGMLGAINVRNLDEQLKRRKIINSETALNFGKEREFMGYCGLGFHGGFSNNIFNETWAPPSDLIRPKIGMFGPEGQNVDSLEAIMERQRELASTQYPSDGPADNHEALLLEMRGLGGPRAVRSHEEALTSFNPPNCTFSRNKAKIGKMEISTEEARLQWLSGGRGDRVGWGD
ncbi:hypothetical protein QQ045_009759 [Rhodiola kirilowii]